MPLALILMLLFGSGATLTVDSSLPGDVLYPIKIKVNERLESLMAVTDSAKKSVESEHTRERIREVSLLNSLRSSVDDGDSEDDRKSVEASTTINKNRSKSGESEQREINSTGSLRVRIYDDEEDEDEDEDDFEERGVVGGVKNIVPAVTPSVQTQVNTVASFTISDVAKHSKSTDCYSSVRGNVYDLTSWIRQHPGGSSAIISMCGVDATDAFLAQHGGQGRPEAELASFKIGVLK